MPFDAMRWFVSRRPAVVVVLWVAALVLVVGLAPDLTRIRTRCMGQEACVIDSCSL